MLRSTEIHSLASFDLFFPLCDPPWFGCSVSYKGRSILLEDGSPGVSMALQPLGPLFFFDAFFSNAPAGA